MQSKISLKLALFVFGIIGAAFFLVFIFFMDPYLAKQFPYTERDAPINNETQQDLIGSNQIEIIQNIVVPKQAILSDRPVKSELPVRIKILSLNIDAAMEYVGLTSDGAMGVPKGPANVAWFDLGPRPGEEGNAVVAGHSGWKDGIPAVFDDLHKLQKGDKIYVEDDKGVTATFVVRESKLYEPTANATDVFTSHDGKSHLNLITCGGVWDTVTKSRSNRLVVFADKE
jgi:LPXTG-site transpeptidase (sortase) family protein